VSGFSPAACPQAAVWFVPGRAGLRLPTAGQPGEQQGQRAVEKAVGFSSTQYPALMLCSKG